MFFTNPVVLNEQNGGTITTAYSRSLDYHLITELY